MSESAATEGCRYITPFFRFFFHPTQSNQTMSLPVAFIDGIGGGELMMIMFIVLLLFGADKLPELARGMGKAMREVKKATSGVEQEIKKAMEEEPASKTLPKPPATVPQQSPTPIPDKSPPYPPSME